MLNRWIGILSLTAMLVANTAIFWRHYLPSLMPTNPPKPIWESGDRQVQVGVFNAADRRIGTSWTVVYSGRNTARVESLTMLNSFVLPNGVETPDLALVTSMTMQQGMLSEFEARVAGLAMDIKLEGEQFGDALGCKWTVGESTGFFSLPEAELRGLSDVIRPFDSLPGLHEGRVWRVKVFNPLAGALPGIDTSGLVPETVLMRVTGVAQIRDPHTGATVDAFVVEDWPDRRSKAWAARDGRVLRQEVDLPVMGRLAILDEPFDEDAYRDARTSIRK